MTGRRWVCPTCGSGALAPSKPRRDDVRRYCLDCSKQTGRLVERTCPALDKDRAARAEKRAALTVQKRAKERDARSAGGVDLIAEARRFWKLPALRDQPYSSRDLPDITIRRSKTKQHTSGHWYGSWPNGRVVVTVGTDPFDAPGAMLHELVHAACPRGTHHSALFWATLRRAAREAWPNATFDFLRAPVGWRCQRAIRDGLRELAAQGKGS